MQSERAQTLACRSHTKYIEWDVKAAGLSMQPLWNHKTVSELGIANWKS